LSFRVEDVGYAIEMLQNLDPRDPLELADDLCEYSRNMLNNNLKMDGPTPSSRLGSRHGSAIDSESGDESAGQGSNLG